MVAPPVRTPSLVLLAVLVAGCGGAGAPRSPDPVAAEATPAEVAELLDRYVRAVNDADPAALQALWAPDAAVSYIHHAERLGSWDDVAEFMGFLRATSARRRLEPSNVVVRTAGDTVWVVFDWEFIATRHDGGEYRVRGFETHVYRRIDGRWRIVHAHHSVPTTSP